ncbi:MAG: hypothetical protein MR030_02635 [Bacteroidales bacterium]|nr:hypothetical protein [Bacteroidales bacterium]
MKYTSIKCYQGHGSLMTYSIGDLDRPHLSEVRVVEVAILSPHVALRAYTVLLTAESLRLSLIA